MAWGTKADHPVLNIPSGPIHLPPLHSPLPTHMAPPSSASLWKLFLPVPGPWLRRPAGRPSSPAPQTSATSSPSQERHALLSHAPVAVVSSQSLRERDSLGVAGTAGWLSEDRDLCSRILQPLQDGHHGLPCFISPENPWGILALPTTVASPWGDAGDTREGEI